MCRTTESGPGSFLAFFRHVDVDVDVDVATRGLWCTLQKHNGRLTDARPQDPRQTTPADPDRRSDDRSPCPQTRTPSAPLRYAKRPRRSCAGFVAAFGVRCRLGLTVLPAARRQRGRPPVFSLLLFKTPLCLSLGVFLGSIDY